MKEEQQQELDLVNIRIQNSLEIQAIPNEIERAKIFSNFHSFYALDNYLKELDRKLSLLEKDLENYESEKSQQEVANLQKQ